MWLLFAGNVCHLCLLSLLSVVALLLINGYQGSLSMRNHLVWFISCMIFACVFQRNEWRDLTLIWHHNLSIATSFLLWWVLISRVGNCIVITHRYMQLRMSSILIPSFAWDFSVNEAFSLTEAAQRYGRYHSEDLWLPQTHVLALFLFFLRMRPDSKDISRSAEGVSSSNLVGERDSSETCSSSRLACCILGSHNHHFIADHLPCMFF